MILDDNDVHSAALCAWKEARGEGIYGCFLVLDVIRNRVGHPGFAATLHDVVYGKNQFTSMSVPSDPEYNLEPTLDDPVFPVLVHGAPKILAGQDNDPTNGALYYANVANTTSGWFFRNIIGRPDLHPITLVYDHHTFYA